MNLRTKSVLVYDMQYEMNSNTVIAVAEIYLTRPKETHQDAASIMLPYRKILIQKWLREYLLDSRKAVTKRAT